MKIFVLCMVLLKLFGYMLTWDPAETSQCLERYPVLHHHFEKESPSTVETPVSGERRQGSGFSEGQLVEPADADPRDTGRLQCV